MYDHMRLLALLALAWLLGGCAVGVDGRGLIIGPPRDTINDLVHKFEEALAKDRAFAIGDLANAKAKATKAGDLLGQALVMCLEPVTVAPYPSEIGVMSLIEDERIVQGCVSSQPLPIIAR